jgi:hypothetical protein
MNRSSHVRRTYISALLLFTASAAFGPEHLADSSTAPILIDMKNRTIDGISISNTPEQFREILGEANVIPFTFTAEGEELLTAYRLRFANGETVNLYEPFVAIDSHGFATESGLGVGSTWEQFREAFPNGGLDWLSDAGAVWSERYKFRLYFDAEGRPNDDALVSRIHMNRPAGHW